MLLKLAFSGIKIILIIVISAAIALAILFVFSLAIQAIAWVLGKEIGNLYTWIKTLQKRYHKHRPKIVASELNNTDFKIICEKCKQTIRDGIKTKREAHSLVNMMNL